MGETEERLREQPSTRFSKDVLRNDLEEEIEVIRNEEMGEGHLKQGHRQKELYREGGNTVSLFYFEEDGRLPSHVVEDGSVSLQVLEGDLQVETSDGKRRVRTNECLFLKPGVGHSLSAGAETVMLMTIMRG